MSIREGLVTTPPPVISGAEKGGHHVSIDLALVELTPDEALVRCCKKLGDGTMQIVMTVHLPLGAWMECHGWARENLSWMQEAAH